MERCKLTLAAALLTKAIRDFQVAESDADFAAVILLAGAVYKIVAPVLVARGVLSRHQRISKGAASIHEKLEQPFSDKAERQLFEKSIRDRQVDTYNSLKHAGDHSDLASALDDLIVRGDLKTEAQFLLEDAASDFYHLWTCFPLPPSFEPPEGFAELLQSDEWLDPMVTSRDDGI